MTREQYIKLCKAFNHSVDEEEFSIYNYGVCKKNNENYSKDIIDRVIERVIKEKIFFPKVAEINQLAEEEYGSLVCNIYKYLLDKGLYFEKQKYGESGYLCNWEYEKACNWAKRGIIPDFLQKVIKDYYNDYLEQENSRNKLLTNSIKYLTN